MDEFSRAPPSSPLLGHSPETLPSRYYFDTDHHDIELKKIWARNWIYAGRLADLPAMTVRRLSLAGQTLILLRDAGGVVSCFHNTCRHRGAELCPNDEIRLQSKLITCPYHEWSYDLQGKLVRTPHVSPPADFRREDHGLFKVHVKLWNGFIFVCLADVPPDFTGVPDLGIDTLDNWPLERLVTGHTLTKDMACNWKIFWENYSECLHCPGIHPELCEMVPIYGKGYMAANEDPAWPADSLESGTRLKAGARSWTMNGQPCGSEFPGLTDAQRSRGQTFVTLWPTMYVVAHVDYVRVVSLRPLGPERTRLHAEWLFPKDTLAARGFALKNVTEFASMVLLQDGAACEANQRGLRASPYKAGRLMPQEFDVFNFQQWIRKQLT